LEQKKEDLELIEAKIWRSCAKISGTANNQRDWHGPCLQWHDRARLAAFLL